ncbi:unnamed protein product, partial [Sphacelaria rigidula]
KPAAILICGLPSLPLSWHTRAPRDAAAKRSRDIAEEVNRHYRAPIDHLGRRKVKNKAGDTKNGAR